MNATIATILWLIAALALVGSVFSMLMLVRNEQVFKFRKKILAEMAAASNQDIRNGMDWMWRYETFERVPYQEMVHKFWKPLEVVDWYDSDDFTRPTRRVSNR